MHLILSTIALVLWATYIIFSYWKWWTNIGIPHWVEDVQHISTYLITVIVLYAVYKYLQIWIQKTQVRFTFWHIIGFTLIQICILSLIFFELPEIKDYPYIAGLSGWGLILFFWICKFLIFPFFITLLSRSLWFSIISHILAGFGSPHWKDEDIRLRLPTETAIWFWVLSLLLLLIWIFGYYTLSGVLMILTLLSIVSYSGWVETWRDIRTRSLRFEWHNPSGTTLLDIFAPKLVSAEIIFLFITFLFGVSLVSIYRPMPIGWDDIGVYMNFPKIMAMSGSALEGVGLYMWQLITGMGFLFGNSAPQAFFINQIGWILSVIAITLGASLLLEEKWKKSLIALPIILSGIFYSMPMIVFQQAKDMKLDPALMFFSVTAITLLMIILRRIGGREAAILEWNKRVNTIPLLILMAIIVGFAFSVKITTLMLILAVFAVLCFRLFWYGGYIGFFFLFIAFFTRLKLWDHLNVVYPKDNPEWITWVFFLFLGLAVVSFVIGIVRHGFRMSRVWILLCMVALTLPLAPWFMKNFSESGSISTAWILGGSGGSFSPDFSLIRTPSELEAIRANQKTAISGSWQASNEDLGRYFWYEEGINNYLKFPPNLTFQRNQWMEFTDITFLYFALLPVLLLFIHSPRHRFAFFILGVVIAMIGYYFIPETTTILSSFFANQELPNGYLWIFWLFILATLAPAKLLSGQSERDKNFQDITLFTAFYGVVFCIAAFWIVWYGISIYYWFLLMIGFASLVFTHYDTEDEKDEETMIGKIVTTSILLLIVFIHFFLYAGPHGWNNLRSSYFPDFKANKVWQETSIFENHADYLVPLATLNLKDPMTAVNAAKATIKTPLIQSYFQSWMVNSVEEMSQLINIIRYGWRADTATIQDVSRAAQVFYNHILYPLASEANTGKIYRIGTFMTYFITQNRLRYFDDSLVTAFWEYFYDTIPELAVNRLKKVGIEYLLVDLNAATIDRDPRHDLTTRMENLLSTFRAKNLSLIYTDSMCLRVALWEYHAWRIDAKKFVSLASVNSESYPGDIMISRGEKLTDCYNYIIGIFQRGNFESEYPYLVPLADAIEKQKIKDPLSLQNFFVQNIRPGYFALFTVDTILDPDMIKNQSPTSTSHSSTTGTGSSTSDSINTPDV